MRDSMEHRTMFMPKNITYYILSGEGEFGNWSRVETYDIESVLKEERCSGDRWARAFQIDGVGMGVDIHNGEYRDVPIEVR